MGCFVLFLLCAGPQADEADAPAADEQARLSAGERAIVRAIEKGSEDLKKLKESIDQLPGRLKQEISPAPAPMGPQSPASEETQPPPVVEPTPPAEPSRPAPSPEAARRTP